MPNLLVELLSEEIPSGMQVRAAQDFKLMMTDGLLKQGLTYDSAESHVSPRRLALIVSGIPSHSPDTVEEIRGPRVDSPDVAIQGFMRKVGIEEISEAQITSDNRGDFYTARSLKQGRSAVEIIQDIVPEVIRIFPWPKSQRWGTGSLRWVRPIRSILALFEDESGSVVVPIDVADITSGKVTYGHRFMCPDEIQVETCSDYAKKLYQAKVLVSHEGRKEVIWDAILNLTLDERLGVTKNEGLLEEVAGLVEWPVVLLGTFDPAFLVLPEEVIIETIRVHQKCFVLSDADTGKLTNRFVIVANIEAIDGGQAIQVGYERVVNARLSDAQYSYAADLKPLSGYSSSLTPLEQRMEKLKNTGSVFHTKLGSQFQRVERIKQLSCYLAPLIGADVGKAARAAYLAKADLTTAIVEELPELQGVMGGYYAVEEDPLVANAIAEHYKPKGALDSVPNEATAITVALADKLDTMLGFWLIDEKPTGSGDPYQLRRAALGVIRIVLENEIKLDLSKTFRVHMTSFDMMHEPAVVEDLMLFVYGRLKSYLSTRIENRSIIQAVLKVDRSSCILSITDRVRSLERFLDTDAGRDLLAWYKRSDNILKAEERKTDDTHEGDIDCASLVVDEEVYLYESVVEAETAIGTMTSNADILEELSKLRGPVDAFFQQVLVNVPEACIRINRLRLLSWLRRLCRTIAEFADIDPV